MGIAISLAAVALLLAANAFFVAAEFALVKARDIRFETLVEEGSAALGRTRRIQGNLEAYLATCRLGTTMTSLGVGWVGASFAVTLLEPLFLALGTPHTVLHVSAAAVGFLVLSSLHLVIGRQVPELIAIRRSVPVSLWVAYPLYLVHLAALPMHWLLGRAVCGVLRLFGANGADSHGDEGAGCGIRGLFQSKEADHDKAIGSEMIPSSAKIFKRHGEIKDDEAQTLRSLFAFDQREIRPIMVPGNQVQILDLANMPHHNLVVMCETEHSHFPLVDGANDGQIAGVVATYDVFNSARKWEVDAWGDLRRFSREPLLVSGAECIAELFELMLRKRTSMALVVDECGKLDGIVTLADLLKDRRK